MALTMRPTGLGSGIDDDRPGYTVFSGGWEVRRLPNLPRSRQSALVLVDDRHRADEALGPSGDPGRGQGAVSEELGRMEGVGEAGRGRLALRWVGGTEAFLRAAVYVRRWIVRMICPQWPYPAAREQNLSDERRLQRSETSYRPSSTWGRQKPLGAPGLEGACRLA